MLIELAIKNFAIIDDIKISFSKGLSILTGETGAGKSIIIEAVNLLLGGRASADLVRAGEKYAELEAHFLIEPNSAPARIMKEYDFNPLEGLKIRRIINLNGKHKIFINSQKSTIQILKLVTENLASISSQHAHQGLLNEENHLDIIDTFAGTWADRREVQIIYNELVPLVKDISSLKSNIDKIKEENELLRFQIDEIEMADIKPQEDETLEMEKNRLKNGSQIYSIIQSGINEIYSKDGSVLEKLGLIKADFEKYSQIDKGLGRSAEILSRAMVELEELADELRKMSDNIDLDPETLEQTQARLDLIQKLKRKYSSIGVNRGTGVNSSSGIGANRGGGVVNVLNSGSLDDLFRNFQAMKERIAETENIAENIEKMEKQASLLSEKIGEKAITLSKKRSDAATNLAYLAENELKELEMENTKFKVLVSQTKAVDKSSGTQIELSPDESISHLLSVHGMKIYPTGIDRVSFLMAPNLGEPPKALNRIASGGELSRVVLALKAVLSANESQGTLVFDEVDSGIGGRTSDKVGIKLKKLSEKYQVICITHLAQIAKHGTTHYKIEKKVVNNRTSTFITPLIDHEERIGELARMMGGTNISQATLDHAAEMLN
ncbi:MAG: DNA repair protein RecN [Desulfamplus sp.]|nr:DNA repair protein RecN [Desulfamplus sp.]